MGPKDGFGMFWSLKYEKMVFGQVRSGFGDGFGDESLSSSLIFAVPLVDSHAFQTA